MDDVSKQRAAVKGLRDAIQKPMKVPIHKLQQAGYQDPGITAPIWVSKVKVPAPLELELRDVLHEALLHLGDEAERSFLKRSEYLSELKAQWTGVRADGKIDKAPDLSEEQKYKNLVKDQKSPFTVLYLQGGSFVTGSASTGRRIVTEICRATGGRAFSISYRLAPQNPFPECLLDVVTAYFYLIAPPSGSQHSPIPPSSIVIAAESAGAALSLGLVQFILYLQQTASNASTKRLCHGRNPSELMPAGCAFLSPAADMTASLPSTDPKDSTDWMVGGAHWHRDYYPVDHLWPSKPPRTDIVTHGALLAHPMLSPATRKDWSGAPPVWMAVGDEASSDGAKVCTQRMAKSSVAVKYVRYEGMPHIFPMLMPKLPQTKHVLRAWGKACKELYEKKEGWLAESGTAKATTVHLGKLEETQSDIATLTDISYEQALDIIYKKRLWTMDSSNAWTGPKTAKSSL